MKLQSADGYPVSIFAKGIPTNLVRNLTPEGKYQIARVLKPGKPTEGDFEILFEGSQQECEKFLWQQVESDFPGLL